MIKSINDVLRYNLFLFNNNTLQNSYIEGDFYVGGNSNIINHYNYSKKKTYGDNLISRPTNDMNDYSNVDSIYNYVCRLSKYWSKLENKTTIKYDNNDLFLIGTNPIINIFNLYSCNFDACNVIINAPKSSTILINIHDKDIELEQFNIYRNYHNTYPDVGKEIKTKESKYIIYNLSNARRLIGRSITHYGTILAPKANIYLFNSIIYGNIIGHNLKGSIDLNTSQFKGNLPLNKVLSFEVIKKTSTYRKKLTYHDEISDYSFDELLYIIIKSIIKLTETINKINKLEAEILKLDVDKRKEEVVKSVKNVQKVTVYYNYLLKNILRKLRKLISYEN